VTVEVLADCVRYLVITVHPVNELIHVGWAFAACKKFGKRYYEDGTWRYENWHELLWTVLTQRPELKSQILRLIAHQLNDPDEAERWRAFNASTSSKRFIPLR
jgi:hypothetical protein